MKAAAANEYAENTKNDVGFRVPKIYWNYTSENVMTLDWVDGISIRETQKLKDKDFNTEKIAEDIIQNFLRHAVRDGFFHADMHQGNIFIDNDGQIVPIDFGIMGRLDKMSKRFLAEILFGFIQRDYRKVAEVHLIAGLVPKEVPIDDLAQALRSIGEPIFGQTVKDISGGKLLKQLFDVTEKFNMQTQPQLLMLQKTMVVVEGVARKLNPNTNIWTTSKPVLENWLKETKDPMTQINETLQNTSEVIKRLPEFPEIMDKANQALTYLASGQIPQNSNSYTALNTQKSQMTTFRNQSIIGLLVLVIFGLIGILIHTMNNLNNKKILLIICGGIAAYKSLEIIRLLKKNGVIIKTILTKSGAEFVTPLSIASLSQSKVYQDLFSLENEAEMDHISLSRWADLILIAPATANTISKLANGNSEDLASTVTLASNKKIFIAPAMNVRMWDHQSTKAKYK